VKFILYLGAGHRAHVGYITDVTETLTVIYFQGETTTHCLLPILPVQVHRVVANVWTDSLGTGQLKAREKHRPQTGPSYFAWSEAECFGYQERWEAGSGWCRMKKKKQEKGHGKKMEWV
jgi:hypothetical protein